MAQEIIEEYDDFDAPVRCDQCGRDMEAFNDCDSPVTRCGEVVAYVYTVGYECPGCDNEIWIPMYKWRFKE